MAIGVQIATFVYVGTAQLNDVFGYFRAPSSSQVQRLQAFAQVGAVGGNITIELVDANGDSLDATPVVIASATNYKDTALAAPITLSPGNVVRAKIIGVDSGVGGYLTVNLVGATSQGPTPPCCC